MRKVFLDGLPKRGKTNQINWKKSVGHKVKFIYEDIEGEVEIVDYELKAQKLNIKYNDIIFPINTSSFMNCMLGTLIGKINKNYVFKIGEIIKTKTGEIQILKQIRMKNKYNGAKGYVYKCLVDKYQGEISENSLIKGAGCSVCVNLKVLKGYNDLWTTHPNIAKMLKYPKRGYEVTYGSNKHEIFVCPDCGHERSCKISSMRTQVSCVVCGDNLSYPNKFIHNFLNQINEECKFEYSPKWSCGKVYDNFLVNKNEIWEVHGLQHYKTSFKGKRRGRNLKEEQENDKFKKELAEKNGCKYIEIDARYSDIEYIKNSLLNLPEIKRYDLSKVDWLKCHEFACSTLVKVACNYWESGLKNTKEIGDIMKLHYSTIIRYLKRGTKLGWCNYNPKEALKDSVRINGKNNNINVVQLSNNGKYIKEWNSMTDASKELGISLNEISETCRGKRKSLGDFMWMYKEVYDKQNLEGLV